MSLRAAESFPGNSRALPGPGRKLPRPNAGQAPGLSPGWPTGERSPGLVVVGPQVESGVSQPSLSGPGSDLCPSSEPPAAGSHQ